MDLDSAGRALGAAVREWGLSLDASWLGPARAEPEKSPSWNGEQRASSRLPTSCKMEFGPSFPKARCSSVQLASLMEVGH